MRMTRIAIIVSSLATICAANAVAQPVTIKPGLWQLEMTVPGGDRGHSMAGMMAQMKSQMASMPPAQRKEMEKMVADFDARGTEFVGDKLRTKVCMTKEDIARYDLLGDKGHASCTQKTTPIAGGMKLNLQCTQPPMKVEAIVKAQSDKAYTFESTTTMPDFDSKMTTQKSSGTGKWLDSDCGKVAPMSSKR